MGEVDRCRRVLLAHRRGLAGIDLARDPVVRPQVVERTGGHVHYAVTVEIGRRGLERVEPNFLEWRENLIKQLMKDVARSFEAPEPEEPEEPAAELEVPEQVEEEPALETAPEPAEEPTEEPAEEEPGAAEEATAEETPPMKMPASVSASVAKPMAFAQAVSFTIHRDLKPTAARSIKLS